MAIPRVLKTRERKLLWVRVPPSPQSDFFIGRPECLEKSIKVQNFQISRILSIVVRSL